MKIEIDNKMYELNLDEAIRLGVLKSVIGTPHSGDVYEFDNSTKINPFVLV